jgi:hypothetical protein
MSITINFQENGSTGLYNAEVVKYSKMLENLLSSTNGDSVNMTQVSQKNFSLFMESTKHFKIDEDVATIDPEKIEDSTLAKECLSKISQQELMDFMIAVDYLDCEYLIKACSCYFAKCLINLLDLSVEDNFTTFKQQYGFPAEKTREEFDAELKDKLRNDPNMITENCLMGEDAVEESSVLGDDEEKSEISESEDEADSEGDDEDDEDDEDNNNNNNN